MVILALGVFTGQSLPDHDDYYKRCHDKCMALCQARKLAILCPFTCWKDCKFDPASFNNEVTAAGNYCKFGCAVQNCFNKNTPRNLGAQEVEDCYNLHCGNKCMQ